MNELLMTNRSDLDGRSSAGSEVTQALFDSRARLERSSTARRVAEILREEITRGRLAPATRLREEAIVDALGISRNSLREAFRLLEHERLVVHDMNRGVYVATLTAAEVSDLYVVREALEIGALQHALALGNLELGRLRATLDRAETAAAAGAWREVATDDLEFHQEIVALAHSPRLDQHMRLLLAELRLAFHAMSSPRRFHEPYLRRNRELIEQLASPTPDAAVPWLRRYLADARRELVDALSSPPPDGQ